MLNILECTAIVYYYISKLIVLLPIDPPTNPALLPFVVRKTKEGSIPITITTHTTAVEGTSLIMSERESMHAFTAV